MAKTRDYMDYLDNQIGIAPANSQEEFQAAETIVEVMKDHGLEPTIQEFDTHPFGELMPNVLYLTLFLGVLLSGLSGGVVRGVGLVLALASAVLLGLNHGGNNVFANLGPVQRSQNVIGVHRASGEKVVKGSRPIVIVAHYDTPRENILFGSAFARYQSTLYKIVYPCVAVAGVMALIQVMGFLPVVLRVLLWVVGLVACVPLILIAVANIMERFAGCTAGSNDNKSSVAAMLSVLNKVSPAEDRVDAAAEGRPYVRRASEDQKPETMMVPEQPVGVRHGKEVLESLGMLPPTCEVIYEEPKLVSVAVDGTQQDGVAGSANAIQQGFEETPAEEAANPQPDAGSPAYVGERNDDASVTGYSDVEENGEDFSGNPEAGQDLQGDDEYYVDNTDEPATQESQYEGVSNQDAAGESIPEASDVDSTVQRTMSDQRRNGKPTSDKKPVGKRISNWFKGIGKKISHRDEQPVRITRGKNKDDDYADYSQYETTYEGDEELDQWSTGETEQLRPLRREEVRRRVNTADDSVDSAGTEPANDQTLGEIYGQFSSDEDTDTATAFVVDAAQNSQGEQYEQELSEAPGPDEASSTDFGVVEEDEKRETQDLDEDKASDIAGPDADSTQSERESAVDNGDSHELPTEASEQAWDVTSDDDQVLDTTNESAQGASDSDDSTDAAIPEPVKIDNIRPQRRTIRKASDEGVESKSQRGSEPEGASDAGASQDANDDLSWDQPSVEDEEYYEEYPQDDDSQGSYEENDEYYERYDEGAYEEGEAEPQAWEDSQYENVYDEATALEGGFHKFVDRVKGLFSHNGRHGEEQQYDDPVEDYDDTSYDEIDEYPNGDGVSAHAAEEDGRNIQFEEVKSEEYLPSKEDALYGDMDDDYDFPETNSSEDTGTQAGKEEEVTKKRATRLQFEEDARERGDILPKDTTGLDTLLDDDYTESDSTERAKPAPIDDPTWGKSTYEPPVSRASIARRAALLDLPNPSAAPVDPLADDDDDYVEDDNGESNAALNGESELDDTAAQNNASNNNRRDNWKGGAALRSDLRSDGEGIPAADDGYVGEEYRESEAIPVAEASEGQTADANLPDEGDMQEAILDLDDDLLLSHDVWFVAVGASSVGHAGIKSFLANFRKDIRGAFLLNLDSIGAGVPVVLTREGLDDGRRADRRSLRLFEDTAKDLHVDVQHIDYGWRDTDATPAMRSRVRSITIMGMDENGLPALSHTQNDVPMNIDPKQVSSIVRTVCEFIRRS